MSANSQPVAHPGIMRLSDLGDVMVLENRNYAFPWTEGIFRDCFKAGYIMQVMRLDLKLIGYGVMQLSTDEAHILNLCIDQGFSRRGYARHLLEKLLDIAEQAGAKMAFLEARPSVPRSIQLYERAGFNKVGLREAYYESVQGREDAIVMAKSIGLPR